MNERKLVRSSKFLSLVLRHRPEAADLTLDDAGWVSVDALLVGCKRARRPLTRAELDEIVHRNNKRRFEFSADRTQIRARQGHSVDVSLGYPPADPPAVLFHGTHPGALDAIQRSGLAKMRRHHVHLSADVPTAQIVGGRRGAPIILAVDAAGMAADGAVFYVTGNGVWLTDAVPASWIRVLSAEEVAALGG